MSYPVLELSTTEYLYGFLRDASLPIIRTALDTSEAGQRIRITTLPGPVMGELCEALQQEERWVARVLVSSGPTKTWEATATKLIELRNTLEKPLLVFIPPGLRTAAEDSLDIATFRELSLSSSVTSDLAVSLTSRFPAQISQVVSQVIALVRRERWAKNEDEIVTYLLTVLLNGSTAESVGGALFVFGLIPHFGLSAQSNLPYWLSRNHKMQQILSDLRQPVQARISRLPLQANTIQPGLFGFLRDRIAQNTRVWTAEIAQHEQQFALDNWPFIETADDTQLRIKLEPLSLPMQSGDEVGGTTPLPVLNLDGKEGLKISFRVVPAPAEVPAWKTYRVQIVLVDGEQPTVAWESNGFKKPASRQKATRTLRIADLQSLEEGTYFIRVDGYDEDGAVLTQPRRLDPSNEGSRSENESEYFLVVREGAEVVMPPPRAIDLPSFTNCWSEANVRAGATDSDEEAIATRDSLTGSWAESTGANVKGDVHFKLEGEGLEGYTIVVPAFLRTLELVSLSNPDQCGRFSLNLANVRSSADIEVKRAVGEPPTTGPELEGFLDARRRLFELILNQHRVRLGDRAQDLTCRSIVETTDLLSLADSIREYADRYRTLGERALGADSNDSKQQSTLFRFLSSVDVAELRWRSGRGDPGRALLLAPTHPLRLLWHLQHARICDEAICHWKEKTANVKSWPVFLRQLASDLLPINLPMVIFDRRGRAYIEQGLLTTHWPLYVPDRSESSTQIDNTATREACRRLLGIGRPAPVTAAISSYEIASRAFEYLQQHPYVEQLRLNVFNPGDGQLITDALRLIESFRLIISGDDGPPPLRYSIQMFGSESQVEGMGEAFESLLDPDRQVAEDDEFTLTSSNHLLPKLVFARNTTEYFREHPVRFSAHMTVLIEQFGSQARLGQVSQMRRGCFVAGLVQEPETSLESREAGFGWYKGLRAVSGAHPSDLDALLTSTVRTTQRLQAASATGEKISSDIAPVLSLHLDADGQSLLLLIHTYSDWVLTIDRNLGLDYFDSPSAPQESGYLLDYAPEFLQEDRHRILLTTRSTIELQSVIRPAIEKFGLTLPPGQEPVVLETLRSLSGRLALKLLSSESHAAEVVGLLLARWLMEQSGLLRDRIVIPLDAHRGWFKSDDAGGGGVRRADLLLVTLLPSQRVVKFLVVEVKLREELTSSGRTTLYREMYEQAESSEKRLRDLFDPHLYPGARADLLLRTKELTTALSFYLKRAVRYGLFRTERVSEILEFVDSLDSGFSLDLASLGVVFERQGVGSHIDEDEPGITVHRFGSDVAEQLLATAGSREVSRVELPDSGGSSSHATPTNLSQRAVATESLISSFGSSVRGIPKAAAPPEIVPSPTFVPHSIGSLTASKIEPSICIQRDAVPEIATLEGSRSQRSSEFENPARALSRDESAPNAQQATYSDASEPETTAQENLSEDPSRAGSDVPEATPAPNVLLGAHELTPQFGILGRFSDAKVGLDLTGCNTISLFGVQGFGKSYTLGVIAEMATTSVPGINVLPSPLATVIFHYHKSDAYVPEFASARTPNNKVREIERLLREYGARPQAIKDIILLTPEAKLSERRDEFPGIEVLPIKFSSGELGAESWKFLLGAYGNDSLYVRQLVAIMRRHREDLTLSRFREEIAASELSQQARRLAEDRLNLAEPYVDDSASLGSLIRPGRTIIVDLRDPWIEKDEALGLFVVMMRIFAAAKHERASFNKLVVFDEAHKYISESELISQVVETIREMRHQATSVVIASQDPLSVPRSVIELTSILILHRMTSPQWLRHLKTAITALEDVSEGQLAGLQAGDALVWAQRSTDKRFTQRPFRIQLRPRFSLHGGGTKTAVSGATVR